MFLTDGFSLAPRGRQRVTSGAAAVNITNRAATLAREDYSGPSCTTVYGRIHGAQAPAQAGHLRISSFSALRKARTKILHTLWKSAFNTQHETKIKKQLRGSPFICSHGWPPSGVI
jgi:hypothetical protein